MANPVGRHLRERLVLTYDEDGKVLCRRTVPVYDDGKSPWYDPSRRHGEPPPKKRKSKLSEQERAAIRDQREQIHRRLAERRQRRAAARGLRAHACREDEELSLVVVEDGLSSVGILRGTPLRLLGDDRVRRIAGREAREVAVSLRCLLKQQSPEAVRRYLRRVLVVGEEAEIERIGRGQFVRELESLGAREVEFELDPFLVANGAMLLAQETGQQTWRRIRRRWR